MTHPLPSDEPLEPDPHEARLGELLNEFYDRRRRGEPLDREDFLDAYPQYAQELRVHLSGLDWLDRIRITTSAASLRPLPDGSDVERAAAADAHPPATRSDLPDIPGYQLLKQIGRGGMGVVYKAVQESTKRIVAVKILLDGSLASEAQRKRFEREIELAARLKHPNIIPIYDSGLAQGRMFCAMAFIYGKPLAAYLREDRPALRERVELFLRIASAVQYAHQRGVIHRDLKPSNILIDVDREPHIFDFGLAKSGDAIDLQASMTAQMIGTPAYMSPEQVEGDPGGIDIRTDVYSLGILLYEMLTGRMPYDTDAPIGKVLDRILHAEPRPPHRFNRQIDADLSAILLKAIEKSKQQRYQSADAMRLDLGRWLGGDTISIRPAGAFYLFRRYLWRRRMAAALVLVLAGFAGFALKTRKDVKQLEQDSERQQVARMPLATNVATQSTPVPDAETVAGFRRMMTRYFSARQAEEFIERARKGDEAALAAITLFKSLNESNEPGTPPPQFNLSPPDALPDLPKYANPPGDSPGPGTREVEQLLKALLWRLVPIPSMDTAAQADDSAAKPQPDPQAVQSGNPDPAIDRG